MTTTPPQSRSEKLRRLLAIRSLALKAVLIGIAGLVLAPLVIIVGEPVGDLSALVDPLRMLCLAVGAVGVIALPFIHFARCPFCRHSFFNPWSPFAIFGNDCCNCGRGLAHTDRSPR